MNIRNFIKSNHYQDSVTLMQIAERLRIAEAVEEVALMMGTDPNKELLRAAGLLTSEGEGAGPNDLIVAFGGSEAAIEAALSQLENVLQSAAPAEATEHAFVPTSLAAGLAAMPETNLVLISTPGPYAAAEARKALLQNRHVMIFSDNVSVEDELQLKTLAAQRKLLVMGPDCGTAIIAGVPLGFANAIRHGSIGVIGASGTGIQEVTTLIDRYGQGVSHAIGTGSHDLAEPVAGLMTLTAFAALLDDPSTKVIVIISKPPHPQVAVRVLTEVTKTTKPVVLTFLGADLSKLEIRDPKLILAHTLEETARRAVQLVAGTLPAMEEPNVDAIDGAVAHLQSSQRYIRGLFSGGTLGYEAMLLLQDAVGGIYSNIPLRTEWALPDARRSFHHTCLDLGADQFTVGKPHPMIDLSARAARIIEEAADPEVAVLLLDVVLGYGAHPNPAEVLAEAIRTAQEHAAADGRILPVVASICGTQNDPQKLEVQRTILADAGVIVAPSNAAAARLAGAIATRNS